MFLYLNEVISVCVLIILGNFYYILLRLYGLRAVICTVSTVIIVRVFSHFTRGKCTSNRKLYGKTALVTGSSRGIGYVTALDLAKRGARVILTSENIEECMWARKQIINETDNKNVLAKHLDFRSFRCVRRFADEILDSEDRLDILVNNAGTIGAGRFLTEDGLFPGLQVNYFGPFLLTNLLLGLMKRTRSARIVNVASIFAQFWIGFDPENIDACRSVEWFEFFIYCYSKLLVVHATKEMARRLEGSGVTVNCLHPGAVYTRLFDDTSNRVVDILVRILGPFFFKSLEEGAQTTIHLAVCPSVENVTGKYFSECKESWILADFSLRTSKKVWEQSMSLTRKKYNISNNLY